MAVKHPSSDYIFRKQMKRSMKKKDLKKLIRKSLSDRPSKTEEQAWEEWYNKMETEEGYLHKLSEKGKKTLENQLLNNIKQNIQGIGHGAKETQSHSIPSKNPKENAPLVLIGLKIAAVFVLGILLCHTAFQLVKHQPQEISHSTDYGQTMEIILPDSSIVTLNGNTTIKYDTDWEQTASREVFLNGEAFFSVKQTAAKQKFVVHASDQFNVEVLGTEFLVSNRKIRTQVVLNSGKVHLNYMEEASNKTIEMSPGDLVTFQNSNPAQYILKRVNPEIYSSWMNHQLILDNTSLMDLCFILQENYGLTVEPSQEHLLNQRVSGSIPLNAIDTLLKDIAVAYGVKINKTNNVIKIMGEG